MRTRIVFGTGVVLVGLLLAPTPSWAQGVGFIAAIHGQVEIQATGTTSFAAATIDREVSIGDTIRTGPASAVKILLADETILTLGESTELEIDTYVVGDAATRDPSVLELLRGKARVIVGEAFGGPTRVEMYTPTAVIGVKGTGFEAYVVEELGRVWTLVCHLAGGIFVRPRDDSAVDPRVVIPRDGLCTEVFRDRPPSDLIPRPPGFAPLASPESGPGDGLTEGDPGGVDPSVVEPPPVGPGPGPGPGGGAGSPPGQDGIQDVVDTLTLDGDDLPSPSGLPGENAPQPPGPGELGENAPQPRAP